MKLDKCPDRQFIIPIVISVKKDQTVKLAWDSKKLYKFIHKNKYKIPTNGGIEQKPTNFILNIRFAFCLLTSPLDKLTQEHCSFSLIGGNATRTYQFQTRFYGLTDMPAEF